MATDWTDRKVLVTGATGLVGSWVVADLLEKGASVVAMVRDVDFTTEFYRRGFHKRCPVVSGRLEEMSDCERAVNETEADTIIHLGAQTIVGAALREPLQTFESNVRGTYNLLEACRRRGELVRRIVVASSDKAYGDAVVLPYEESMPLKGRHPYDVSKSCTDLISQAYWHSYGLPVAIARCGNIFGGGDLNWSRIVPGTIRSVIEGRRPVIRSNGKFVRDYIYVKDVSSAYLLLADALGKRKAAGEAYNFSLESSVTVDEIVAETLAVMKSKLKPDIRSMKLKEIPDQSLSATKARKELGWKPKYTLRAGLAETVKWYKEYLSEKR